MRRSLVQDSSLASGVFKAGCAELLNYYYHSESAELTVRDLICWPASE